MIEIGIAQCCGLVFVVLSMLAIGLWVDDRLARRRVRRACEHYAKTPRLRVIDGYRRTEFPAAKSVVTRHLGTGTGGDAA
jgi:hypothetical protein